MRKLLCVFFILFYGTRLPAQPPRPGDIFREYVWLPDMVSESEKFLRVGGRLGYKINPEHFPPEMHSEGHIPLNIDFDLENAIKCELVFEKYSPTKTPEDFRCRSITKAGLTFPMPREYLPRNLPICITITRLLKFLLSS